jgi:hypothetical protein
MTVATDVLLDVVSGVVAGGTLILAGFTFRLAQATRQALKQNAALVDDSRAQVEAAKRQLVTAYATYRAEYRPLLLPKAYGASHTGSHLRLPCSGTILEVAAFPRRT